MKIKDIIDVNTGRTRTDDRYPQRIGSEVEFFREPVIGECMYLAYITDNQGYAKDGLLRTSIITDIIEAIDVVVVQTINSVYYLER